MEQKEMMEVKEIQVERAMRRNDAPPPNAAPMRELAAPIIEKAAPRLMKEKADAPMMKADAPKKMMAAPPLQKLAMNEKDVAPRKNIMAKKDEAPKKEKEKKNKVLDEEKEVEEDLEMHFDMADNDADFKDWDRKIVDKATRLSPIVRVYAHKVLPSRKIG